MPKASTPRATPVDSAAAIRKAKTLAQALHDKKALALTLISLKGVSEVAQAALIASATSVRHGQSLADAAKAALKEMNEPPLGVEGYESGQWILVDSADVLIHVFQPDARRTFDLEGLWADGARVELGFAPAKKEDDWE